jgi:hypothetical protein
MTTGSRAPAAGLRRTPARLPAPLRHVIAQALPPLYAYLIPLLAAAFVLALILKEISLRTR